MLGFLIALVMAGGILFTVLMVVVLGGHSAARNKALANKDQVLDDLFAGEPPTVTFREWGGSLPADVVIDGAHRRGYRVLTETRPTASSREVTFGR